MSWTDTVSEIRKLHAAETVSALFASTALFGPGTLMLFRFREDLLRTLPVIPFLLLVVSLSVPFFICNFFLLIHTTERLPHRRSLYLFCIAGVVVHLVSAPPLLLSEMFDWSFFTFSLLAIVWQVLVITFLNGAYERIKKQQAEKAVEQEDGVGRSQPRSDLS